MTLLKTFWIWLIGLFTPDHYEETRGDTATRMLFRRRDHDKKN